MNKQFFAMMMAVLGGFHVVHASGPSSGDPQLTAWLGAEPTPTPIPTPTPTPTYGWQKALPSTASDKAQANRAALWAKKGYQPTVPSNWY